MRRNIIFLFGMLVGGNIIYLMSPLLLGAAANSGGVTLSEASFLWMGELLAACGIGVLGWLVHDLKEKREDDRRQTTKDILHVSDSLKDRLLALESRVTALETSVAQVIKSQSDSSINHTVRFADKEDVRRELNQIWEVIRKPVKGS